MTVYKHHSKTDFFVGSGASLSPRVGIQNEIQKGRYNRHAVL